MFNGPLMYSRHSPNVYGTPKTRQKFTFYGIVTNITQSEKWTVTYILSMHSQCTKKPLTNSSCPQRALLTFDALHAQKETKIMQSEKLLLVYFHSTYHINFRKSLTNFYVYTNMVNGPLMYLRHSPNFHGTPKTRKTRNLL